MSILPSRALEIACPSTLTRGPSISYPIHCYNDSQVRGHEFTEALASMAQALQCLPKNLSQAFGVPLRPAAQIEVAEAQISGDSISVLPGLLQNGKPWCSKNSKEPCQEIANRDPPSNNSDSRGSA
jgi:hypothetical protein